MGGYGGGAGPKAGQPWVAVAELSLGGPRLLADLPGQDKQRLFYSSLCIPEESVDHDNSPVISARSLGSCQTVTRGLRSESVTKPISLARSPSSPENLLVGAGRGQVGPQRTGGPHPRGPPGDQDLSAQILDLCVARKRASRLRTSGWKSDKPGAASCYPLGPHHLRLMEQDAEAQKLRHPVTQHGSDAACQQTPGRPASQPWCLSRHKAVK